MFVKVTKSAFCEAAITYARGELPRESGELTPQQQSDFEKANLLKKVN